MTGSTQQGYLAMMLKGGPRIRWQPQQGGVGGQEPRLGS
jgi:hypothetical protein